MLMFKMKYLFIRKLKILIKICKCIITIFFFIIIIIIDVVVVVIIIIIIVVVVVVVVPSNYVITESSSQIHSTPSKHIFHNLISIHFSGLFHFCFVVVVLLCFVVVLLLFFCFVLFFRNSFEMSDFEILCVNQLFSNKRPNEIDRVYMK